MAPPSFTRFYLTTRIGNGLSDNPYRPKGLLEDDGTSWIAGPITCQDYGNEPSYYVTASVTGAEHAKLIRSYTEVIPIHPHPDNPGPPSPDRGLPLDIPYGTYAVVLREALELHNFPGLWVSPETTPRAFTRHMQRCIHLAQRMQRFGRLFPPGVTLDMEIGAIFPDQRQLMMNAVIASGGTPPILDDANTVRDVITLMSLQCPYPAKLLGVVL